MEGRDHSDIPFVDDAEDDPYWASKSRIQTYSNRARHRRSKDFVIQIKPRTIRIDKLFFERALYFFIILALVLIVIKNPLTNMSFGSQEGEATGAVVLSGAPEVKNTTQEEKTQVVVQKPEENKTEKKVVNETKKIEEPPEPKLSGVIDLEIESVQTDVYPTGNGGKITGVWVRIDNGKEAFRPKVELYVYDSNSPAIYKNKPRDTESFATLLAGKNTRRIMDDFTAQFSEISSKKTIKAVLIDQDSSIILKQRVLEVKIS